MHDFNLMQVFTLTRFNFKFSSTSNYVIFLLIFTRAIKKYYIIIICRVQWQNMVFTLLC